MKPTTWVLLPVFVGTLAAPAAGQSADRWTGRDKALHFVVGAGLAGGAYAGTALVSESRTPRVVVGLTIGIGANAAKEVKDRRSAGDPSWKDFVVGALGAAAGTTFAWAIDRAVSHQPPSGIIGR